MAEILTEKGICDSCGSKVRDGSAFCFSCGESLVVEPAPPPILKPATGTLEGSRNGGLHAAAYSEPELRPVPAPVSEPIVSRPETTPVRATNILERRPAKSRKVKTVEVEWVEPRPSAALFLIASLLLAGIAAGLVIAAYYLK